MCIDHWCQYSDLCVEYMHTELCDTAWKLGEKGDHDEHIITLNMAVKDNRPEHMKHCDVEE